MSSKRRSYEAGHKRKYLVVIDDTEECDRAVFWAAKRAGRTKSQIVMLRVIETAERSQHVDGPEHPMSADRVRWEHIQRVYESCERNVSETARQLNMHRRTLQRILGKRAPR